MAGEIKPYAYTFALHFVFIICSSPQRVFMPQLAFPFFSLHLLSVCITWSLPSPTHGLMLLNSSFWTKPNFASDMKHVSPLMLLFNYQNPNRSFTFPFPFLSLLLLFLVKIILDEGQHIRTTRINSGTILYAMPIVKLDLIMALDSNGA